ncbi:hypothetical protein [Marinobacter sp. F4218]|uniref:hypothetical protein n=1 Tax=Marinobacter sp. F4218 TaxID=2862868 RepID=UPI001E346383|nr:hypothetical protein [Marinobacter sp. F4218]
MSRSRALWLALVLGLASQSLVADENCQQSARTDLERLYCQVIAEGAGQNLPSQADFRRNDPEVQALLLRGPARRLGIQMPDAEGASDRLESPVAARPAEPVPESRDPRPARRGRLSDCRLEGERITCPDRNFDLALNRPNSELAPGVLARDNRLGLNAYEGDLANETAVRRYLSDAYDRYIPKMVEIGLGANTMSFTAFYNAFQTLEGGGVNFAGRMEQTFQLLKQDKQSLAVKARYHEELPDNLFLCDAVNRDIIVCDNVGTNWVFVRSDR